MNEEESNLQFWVDPELEASIVALVLGEASDFEAEKLERLIGEKPELAIYRARIEKMYGLLSEVAAGGPKAEGGGGAGSAERWTLPDERKHELLTAIGEAPFRSEKANASADSDEPAAPAARSKVARFPWRQFTRVAAILVLLGAVVSITDFFSLSQNESFSLNRAPIVTAEADSAGSTGMARRGGAKSEVADAPFAIGGESESQDYGYTTGFSSGPAVNSGPNPAEGDNSSRSNASSSLSKLNETMSLAAVPTTPSASLSDNVFYEDFWATSAVTNPAPSGSDGQGLEMPDIRARTGRKFSGIGHGGSSFEDPDQPLEESRWGAAEGLVVNSPDNGITITGNSQPNMSPPTGRPSLESPAFALGLEPGLEGRKNGQNPGEAAGGGFAGASQESAPKAEEAAKGVRIAAASTVAGPIEALDMVHEATRPMPSIKKVDELVKEEQTTPDALRDDYAALTKKAAKLDKAAGDTSLGQEPRQETMNELRQVMEERLEKAQEMAAAQQETDESQAKDFATYSGRELVEVERRSSESLMQKDLSQLGDLPMIGKLFKQADSAPGSGKEGGGSEAGSREAAAKAPQRPLNLSFDVPEARGRMTKRSRNPDAVSNANLQAHEHLEEIVVDEETASGGKASGLVAGETAESLASLNKSINQATGGLELQSQIKEVEMAYRMQQADVAADLEEFRKSAPVNGPEGGDGIDRAASPQLLAAMVDISGIGRDDDEERATPEGDSDSDGEIDLKRKALTRDFVSNPGKANPIDDLAVQWTDSVASSGLFAAGNTHLNSNIRTSGKGDVNVIAGWIADDADGNGSESQPATARQFQEGFGRTPGRARAADGTVVFGAGGEFVVDTTGNARNSVRGVGQNAIDLNLTPEVVEFEGFVNDGSPIERRSGNQTRTEFLSRIAEGWELPAPASLTGSEISREFIYSTEYDPPEIPNMIGQRYTGDTFSKEDSPFPIAQDESKTGRFVHLGFRDKGQTFTAQRVVPPAGLEEKNAAEESFSTFSLHVSDVSFKLAQAALAKGEWPEAGKVRIEEFVNALDYGDPNPTQDDKVACRIEQAIHPFLQQRNLMRVAMRTAAAGRAGDTPLRLTFLLDNSGSMERADREETVRRAFALLADQLQPIDQVTLISFARQPRLLADKVSGDQSRDLVEVVANLPSEGGTNLEAALKLAFEKAQEQKIDKAQNRIVLLTDGAANLGNAKPESLAAMIESMREEGIAFDAAGIGADGLNDEILEALTRKGDGRYYLLDRPEDADDGFARQIAGALRPAAKNVKVQVEFNPDRVGNYKLLGFEKHRLKKEDFRDDSVDAAEMAAEEAGVAVYQFEARPDGEGDVGFVSVRFRDMSSGEMVEKRWPIPYEPSAPRPDQAAPSMQLATVAALFAAKLNGEPLGDTVELEELAKTIGSLPASFQNKERVQQLRQMIEQARNLAK